MFKLGFCLLFHSFYVQISYWSKILLCAHFSLTSPQSVILQKGAWIQIKLITNLDAMFCLLDCIRVQNQCFTICISFTAKTQIGVWAIKDLHETSTIVTELTRSAFLYLSVYPLIDLIVRRYKQLSHFNLMVHLLSIPPLLFHLPSLSPSTLHMSFCIVSLLGMKSWLSDII